MNSASPVSSLPQELIDKVIEETGTDTATLRSCALVCRTFLRCSQARMFLHIEILPISSAPWQLAQRLHLALQHSPHLCLYIRSLRIVEGWTPATRWVTDPALIDILSMLTVLTSFDFEAQEARDSMWMSLPTELRVAMCELCQRSPLVKLRLVNLGKFAELHEFASLVASPALTDLTFSNIELPPLTVAHGGPFPTRCTFNLTPPSFEVVLHWLAEGEAFSRLQHLNTAWTSGTTDGIQRILDASSSSLEEFQLTLKEAPSSSVSQTLILVNSSALLSLRLTLMLRVEDSTGFVPWLAALMQAPQGPKPLADIVLRIYLLTAMNPLIPISPIDWTPLADVLGPRQFPALRSLTLELISFLPGFDDPLRTITEEAKRGMQELEARGVLKFTILSGQHLRI
ncbi:hypothetical protein DFH09DRAFT_1178122 [Mycena vulgaris]|nr:hypothetical protein DFH09DRAFT_1178122 [Mycena vulgaris]